MCFETTRDARRPGAEARGGPRRIQRYYIETGFSFIEIMVVVVIIGVLATAVTLKYSDYMETARVNRAKSDIATLQDAIENYKNLNGRYPANNEGLDALPLKHGNRTDPWGNPYQYNRPGREGPYEIVCFGADGKEGGRGVNADIYSWRLNQQQKAGP
jgi:general secretion pathway protein G